MSLNHQEWDQSEVDNHEPVGVTNQTILIYLSNPSDALVLSILAQLK